MTQPTTWRAVCRRAPDNPIELLAYGSDSDVVKMTLTPAEALALAESLLAATTSRLHEIRIQDHAGIARMFTP